MNKPFAVNLNAVAKCHSDLFANTMGSSRWRRRQLLSKAAGAVQVPCPRAVPGKGCATSPARPGAGAMRHPSKEKISCLQKDPRVPSLSPKPAFIGFLFPRNSRTAQRTDRGFVSERGISRTSEHVKTCCRNSCASARRVGRPSGILNRFPDVARVSSQNACAVPQSPEKYIPAGKERPVPPCCLMRLSVVL
jgi:hypothetical protein